MTAAEPEPSRPATSGPAAPYYRDVDEFNRRLDTAAETIRSASPADRVLNVLWYLLAAVQAFLYLADWILGWNLRRELIPGIDLTRPLWVAIVGFALVYRAWNRNQQGRILRNRLCLDCGHGLLDAPVDERGRGTCPVCGRDFNLGEYRRPGENVGRGFEGYIDREHFDKAMYAAAEQIRTTRGMGFEAELIGWGWIVALVALGLELLLDWTPLEWVGYVEPRTLILIAILSVWSAAYHFRVSRLKPHIAARRLCLNCGYCLLETPLDVGGLGRCPECGGEFVAGQYDAPAEPAGPAEPGA